MASGSNYLQPQILYFIGKNYDNWQIKMKTLFHSQDLLDMIERGFVEPQDESQLTRNQRDELKENRWKDARPL